MFSIILAALFTENVVLTKFLGLCPFMGVSRNRKNALSMGISVMIVVTIVR